MRERDWGKCLLNFSLSCSILSPSIYDAQLLKISRSVSLSLLIKISLSLPLSLSRNENIKKPNLLPQIYNQAHDDVEDRMMVIFMKFQLQTQSRSLDIKIIIQINLDHWLVFSLLISYLKFRIRSWSLSWSMVNPKNSMRESWETTHKRSEQEGHTMKRDRDSHACNNQREEKENGIRSQRDEQGRECQMKRKKWRAEEER